MTNTPDTPNSPDPYGERQPDMPNQAPPVQKAQYVPQDPHMYQACLLYTSDAADE